jgi:hypothetical protein
MLYQSVSEALGFAIMFREKERNDMNKAAKIPMLLEVRTNR